MTAKAQRHDKESRLAVLATARVASWSAFAVVDLLLGPDVGLEPTANFQLGRPNSARKRLTAS